MDRSEANRVALVLDVALSGVAEDSRYAPPLSSAVVDALYFFLSIPVQRHIHMKYPRMGLMDRFPWSKGEIVLATSKEWGRQGR